MDMDSKPEGTIHGAISLQKSLGYTSGGNISYLSNCMGTEGSNKYFCVHMEYCVRPLDSEGQSSQEEEYQRSGGNMLSDMFP